MTGGLDRPATPYTIIHGLANDAATHAVDLARDAVGDSVVLKRLRESHRDREDLALRLQLEGEVLRELAGSHGVVRLTGIEHDPLTLVLEYIRGGSLADRLRDARSLGITIPVARALAVARGLLTALAHAHDHGVVHRDVNPSNVLFAADGTVRLIDFGVAARSDPARDGACHGLPADWVEERVGTLPYSAPESVLDPTAPATPMQDVFAAGVVLFEMLAGTTPWCLTRDESPAAFAERVARSTDVPSLPAGLAPDVGEVVAAALDPNPASRLSSARAFADALPR